MANAPYLVKFHVSLADSSLLAIDRLGAYLSVGAVGPVPNVAPLGVTPQVESPANVPLSNAAGWTLISGIVVASGGEDDIVIGSFRDDASTNTMRGPGTWPDGSYYYIDDVSVELSVPSEQACCLNHGTCSIGHRTTPRGPDAMEPCTKHATAKERPRRPFLRFSCGPSVAWLRRRSIVRRPSAVRTAPRPPTAPRAAARSA